MVITNDLDVIFLSIQHLLEVVCDPHFIAPVQILLRARGPFRYSLCFIKCCIWILVVVQAQSNSSAGQDHAVHLRLLLQTDIHPTACAMLGGTI